jgi:hypothetical protein
MYNHRVYTYNYIMYNYIYHLVMTFTVRHGKIRHLE